MIEIELLTRAGCHLCDEMKEALLRASTGLDVRLTETDVDRDEGLAAQYSNDVPVLFVNGRKAFKHRTTVDALRERLLKEAKDGG